VKPDIAAAKRRMAVSNANIGVATYLDVETAQNVMLGIERTGVRLRGKQLVSVADGRRRRATPMTPDSRRGLRNH